MSTSPPVIAMQAKFYFWARLFCRLFLMVFLFAYAAAKFVGAQFVTTGTTLDIPAGELSGIELTWIYFGYSTLMSSFVLGGQATAAVLLGYARTARLGALILLPIISNIVVINFAFNIGTDTKIFSIILLLMDLFLLAGDWSLWKRIFWEEIPSEPAQPAILGNPTIKKFKVFLVPLCAVMIYALICYAQSNNAPRTPLTGDWKLTSATVNGKDSKDASLGSGWWKISFEAFGRFGARIPEGYLSGRYSVEPSTNSLHLKYDPTRTPTRWEQPSDAQLRQLYADQLADYRWPVDVTCTYRLENDRLIITGSRGEDKFEWVLVPFVRSRQ
ncbi:hypothetical protein KIH39_23920 [Telmatocola sphagniphila]|uniref:DoxX family protein n=1 Tax=Telmatocola sphagniphila TaxID=1123043 RepID=A0A8E6B5R0_9BACT|nr:hypothetical protein [Telmatocola sphagniphila]QVL31847.1 hypothetical protein KIH39_23920 [Telmatocola sphagniphila]